MSRILLYGLCPLPFENTRKTFGPGIRSWQFARGLASGGHEVRLVALQIPGAYEEGEAVGTEEQEGVAIERLEATRFYDLTRLERHIRSHRPDALVGATVYGSYTLARGDGSLPLWADQFGHVMAEAQARAARQGANWPLAYFWRMQRLVLRRADKLSVVSERQRYAAVGELGALGRLTAETCGYEFTAVIPCALVPECPGARCRAVRGVKVPEEAFIVLWSGSYNVWSDVRTLFRALELAMRQDPRVHFVSTGGEIEGQDERTYPELCESVASSEFRDRYHLEGWISAERVPSYVAEADLGVLTELPIYEGLLGDKNRIVQWMGAGLPAAYNRIGDLGDHLEKDLALTFKLGDAEALAGRILWAADHPEELKRLAVRAQDYAFQHRSFEVTTRELCRWAENPSFSPDRGLRRSIRSPLDHADLRQRLVSWAESVPALRRSPILRRIWRWTFAGLRSVRKSMRRGF